MLNGHFSMLMIWVGVITEAQFLGGGGGGGGGGVERVKLFSLKLLIQVYIRLFLFNFLFFFYLSLNQLLNIKHLILYINTLNV